MFSHVSKGILSELPHEDTLLTAVLTPVWWMTLQCSQERATTGSMRARCALYFHGGSKSLGDRTQLKYGMYSMHDAYITPLWPYSGKTDDLYRCGFGPSFFFWRKAVLIPQTTRSYPEQLNGSKRGARAFSGPCPWVNFMLFECDLAKKPVYLAGETVTVL